MSSRSFPLIALLAATACAQSSTTTTIPPATAILIDPTEFLGGVACSNAPGGLRRYVATLVDVSSLRSVHLDGGAFALPSSEPTPCYWKVQFERISPGRQYMAEIDGYDRDDIHPLGEQRGKGATGSRVMVDAKEQYVAPRWRTSCGAEAAEPGEAGDAGDADDAQPTFDASPVDARASTPRDAGPETGVYLDCRRAVPPDGGPAEQTGPFCAMLDETIVMRRCAPLREVTALP